MIKKMLAVLGGTAVLAGCATAPEQPPGTVGPIIPAKVYTAPKTPATTPTAPGSIMGADMASLVSMFGQPRLDVIEPYGRKLQFSGTACILDAYLYPKGANGKEIVTHVDARNGEGAEVDRSACIAALGRRR